MSVCNLVALSQAPVSVEQPLDPGLIKLEEVVLPPQFCKQEAMQKIENTHIIALFLIKLVTQSATAYSESDYLRFDANPGDGGCQNRALLLHQIHCMARERLNGELESLSRVCSGGSVKKGCPGGIQGELTKARQSNNRDLILRHLEPIVVSEDLAFLLHCYLSKAMRMVKSIDADGVVTTESRVDGLSLIEPKMNGIPLSLRHQILQYNQSTLSASTAEGLYRLVASLMGNRAEGDLTCKMLSPEHQVMFSPNKALYMEKTFSCLYYSMKAVLAQLKETRAIICLEEIVPIDRKGKEMRVALQSPERGSDFKVMEQSIPSNSPVVVCTAVIKRGDATLTRGELIDYLQKVDSITDLMLKQAADQSPYQRESKLEDVKDPLAQREISHYRSRDIQTVVRLDHLYLCVMKEGRCVQ